MMYGGFCDTPLGRLGILCTETALFSIDRMDELPYPVQETPLIKRVQGELLEYFSGARREFDVPLDETQGTQFQKKVWKAVIQIPYGQTRSYQEVAEMVGRPKAARAVGGAVGRTPFPLIVPCHRVISSSGGLGGYGGRLDQKAFLLNLEQTVCRQDAGKSFLLFDLDGTLTDPKEGITRSVQYALQDFGIIEPDLDALLCFIGPPLAQSFQDYYGFDKSEAAMAVAKYRERFSAVGVYENRLLDGVPAMLSQLKATGKKICLATSKPTVFAKKILQMFEIARYFDFIIGSELDGRRSQKSEVIEEALRIGGFEHQREKAIMIGDRHHDIDGAVACGIDSVGVTFGYAEPGELERAGATYIAGSISQLQDLLQKL